MKESLMSKAEVKIKKEEWPNYRTLTVRVPVWVYDKIKDKAKKLDCSMNELSSGILEIAVQE